MYALLLFYFRRCCVLAWVHEPLLLLLVYVPIAVQFDCSRAGLGFALLGVDGASIGTFSKADDQTPGEATTMKDK